MTPKIEVLAEQTNGYIPIKASVDRLSTHVKMRIIAKLLESSIPEVSPINEDASCAYEDPELFFPIGDRDNSSRLKQTELAKAICNTCLVNFECRNFAIVNGIKMSDRKEDYGIQGGLDEFERQDIRAVMLKRQKKINNNQ